VYGVLVGTALVGATIGAVIGRTTAPTRIETVPEVITVDSNELPNLGLYTKLYNVPLSDSLQRYIFDISTQEEVPVALVMAMIEHESQFNPEIISETNDYGLMQINFINHEHLKEEFRCADMLNPYQNVFCGIKIISSYLKKYDGDYHKALMAYNLGEYGASKSWGEGVHTTFYSRSITKLMEKY
jgi:soluble lytic murein transglycosylase-like protein